MQTAGRRVRWELVAPCIVLFILPVAHTTPLRFVCIGLSVIAALATLRHHRAARMPPRLVFAAIALWFCVCIAASLASIEPAYSWGEFRNEALTPTIAFAVFFWLTDDVATWRRFRLVLLASFFAVSVIAIVSYQCDADWLRSSFVGDRNAFSTYVVLIVPLLLLSWVSPDLTGRTWRAVLAAALLLAVVAGASTQNRNMWFAIAAECIVFAGVVWLRAPAAAKRRLGLRLVVVGAIGAVAFVGLMVVVIQQKAIVSKTSTEEQARFDRDPRFEIWRYAESRIAERPWTGYGYGRGILRRDFRARFGDPLKWHGHNMAIDAVMEAGVAGGIAIRVARGLSQEKVAADAAVDRAYLGGLERQDENPTVDLLDRVAGALSVTIADLFAEPPPGGPAPRPLRPGRRRLPDRSL